MSIDTEELKESCDSQLTTLASMGAYSHNWDIKTTLMEEINEILVHMHTVIYSLGNFMSNYMYILELE